MKNLVIVLGLISLIVMVIAAGLVNQVLALIIFFSAAAIFISCIFAFVYIDDKQQTKEIERLYSIK